MEYELYHYGVKGQKWGVRRYQNADGSLTAAGKKKARQEYKEDNRKAYELGKSATVSGHATARSMKRTIKLENKLDKQLDRDTKRGNDLGSVSRRTKSLTEKWNASVKTTAQLSELYMNNKTAAEQHCKSLIDKYGQEAVSSIKYKNIKLPKGKYSPDSIETINEKTNTVSDYARAGAESLLATGMMQAMNIPFAALYYPKSASGKAVDVERAAYITNLTKKNNDPVANNPTEIVSTSSNKNAKEMVRKYKDYESGSVTNMSKALTSKTPYYALSDKEKNSITRSYEDRRANLINQRNNAKSSEQKQKIVEQLDELELDYLEIVERDW